jgi:hypothetical protein
LRGVRLLVFSSCRVLLLRSVVRAGAELSFRSGSAVLAGAGADSLAGAGLVCSAGLEGAGADLSTGRSAALAGAGADSLGAAGAGLACSVVLAGAGADLSAGRSVVLAGAGADLSTGRSVALAGAGVERSGCEERSVVRAGAGVLDRWGAAGVVVSVRLGVSGVGAVAFSRGWRLGCSICGEATRGLPSVDCTGRSCLLRGVALSGARFSSCWLRRTSVLRVVVPLVVPD